MVVKGETTEESMNSSSSDAELHEPMLTAKEQIHSIDVSKKLVVEDDEQNNDSNKCDVEEDEGKNDSNKCDVEDDNGLPIDRGWAWVISLAAHGNQMLKVGYTRSMGLFFIEFLRVYQTSATVTTLISGVLAGMFACSVFITMQLLVGRFQIRSVVMTGGLLSATGIITSAFAPNVITLIILQGVLIGIGNSMMHGPALVLMGQYFKTKRGLGTAIANSGISTGAILFPPLVKYLIDEYGLQGALLIVGAIQLHVVTFALLMRPFEFYKKKPPKPTITEMESMKNGHLKAEQETLLKPKTNADCNSIERLTKSENAIFENHPQSPASQVTNKRARFLSQTSHNSMYHSQGDIMSVVPGTDPPSRDTEKKKTGTSNPCSNLDFSLWKSPLFVLIGVTGSFACANVIFLSYYPAFVTDQGTSETDAATFMSIAGGLDFFARLGAGHFSDLGYFKRSYICVGSLVLSGLNCQMITFYDTYGLQLMGVIIYGLTGGIFTSFIPLLIIDFLGAEHLAKALSFILIMIGAAISMYHPVVGAIKDATGSYKEAYNTLGAAMLLAAILLLFEPLFQRCEKRREPEVKATKETV